MHATDGTTTVTIPLDARWRVPDGAQGVIVERPAVNFDELDIDGYIERTAGNPSKQKPSPDVSHGNRGLVIKLRGV